tara:strand:- start:1577 stop:2050 length:474 start_codon:yes stop_codon:yes gene_type:complete
MAYDLENLMSDVKSVMVDNLNTKIGAINTEKSDGTTLLTVDSSAYFLQDLNSATINHNPFIFYNCEEIEGTGFGPNTPQEFLINCILVLADQSAYSDISVRMFRYLRALKEIFEENFSIKTNSNFISINLLTPVPLTTLNEVQEFRATGIQIRSSIG